VTNRATGGNGGIGISSSITGSSVQYAGGGGGGADTGTGGVGTYGGGSGGIPRALGNDGTVNTGGGGGAAGYGATLNSSSGAGGSGVVILRYPNTYAYATANTGNPNVILSGGNIIYRFWQSGSITF
jgi:hypothetical protein